MREDIKKIIEHHSTSMSKFQIKHFVLGDKITNYRVIKQLLMEIETRYNGIEEEELIIEETNIKLKYIIEKSNGTGEEAELASITKKRLKNSLKVSNKRLFGLKYELSELEATFDEISKNIDITTLINNEEEESNYWTYKFIRDAQFDIMTTGKLQKGLLEAISTLPMQTQEEIVNQAIYNSAKSNGYLAQAEDNIIKKLNDNNEKISLTFETNND